MKNVTITLDEEVARWVRIAAARQETSVSRLVGEMLSRQMEEEQGYEAARRRYLARPAASLRRPGERLPGRDDLHDRALLR